MVKEAQASGKQPAEVRPRVMKIRKEYEGRIEAILDYAKAIGYRAGENPAAWKGNLAHALPARARVRKVEHHASLPYAELPEFMAELRERAGLAARCLEFVILTACRTGDDSKRPRKSGAAPSPLLCSCTTHLFPPAPYGLPGNLLQTEPYCQENMAIRATRDKVRARSIRRAARADDASD